MAARLAPDDDPVHEAFDPSELSAVAQVYLHQHNLRIKDEGASGNCFFLSLAAVLPDAIFTHIHAKTLRAVCASHMETLWDAAIEDAQYGDKDHMQWLAAAFGSRPVDEERQQAWVAGVKKRMQLIAKDGHWDSDSGDMVTYIMADALGIQIDVLDARNSSIHEFHSPRFAPLKEYGCLPTVALARKGLHYQACVPVSECEFRVEYRTVRNVLAYERLAKDQPSLFLFVEDLRSFWDSDTSKGEGTAIVRPARTEESAQKNEFKGRSFGIPVSSTSDTHTAWKTLGHAVGTYGDVRLTVASVIDAMCERLRGELDGVRGSFLIIYLPSIQDPLVAVRNVLDTDKFKNGALVRDYIHYRILQVIRAFRTIRRQVKSSTAAPAAVRSSLADSRTDAGWVGAYIANQGLAPQAAKPGGDSFFHALAAALPHATFSPPDHKLLRKIFVEHAGEVLRVAALTNNEKEMGLFAKWYASELQSSTKDELLAAAKKALPRASEAGHWTRAEDAVVPYVMSDALGIEFVLLNPSRNAAPVRVWAGRLTSHQKRGCVPVVTFVVVNSGETTTYSACIPIQECAFQVTYIELEYAHDGGDYGKMVSEAEEYKKRIDQYAGLYIYTDDVRAHMKRDRTQGADSSSVRPARGDVDRPKQFKGVSMGIPIGGGTQTAWEDMMTEVKFEGPDDETVYTAKVEQLVDEALTNIRKQLAKMKLPDQIVYIPVESVYPCPVLHTGLLKTDPFVLEMILMSLLKVIREFKKPIPRGGAGPNASSAAQPEGRASSTATGSDPGGSATGDMQTAEASTAHVSPYDILLQQHIRFALYGNTEAQWKRFVDVDASAASVSRFVSSWDLYVHLVAYAPRQRYFAEIVPLDISAVPTEDFAELYDDAMFSAQQRHGDAMQYSEYVNAVKHSFIPPGRVRRGLQHVIAHVHAFAASPYLCFLAQCAVREQLNADGDSGDVHLGKCILWMIYYLTNVGAFVHNEAVEWKDPGAITSVYELPTHMGVLTDTAKAHESWEKLFVGAGWDAKAAVTHGSIYQRCVSVLGKTDKDADVFQSTVLFWILRDLAYDWPDRTRMGVFYTMMASINAAAQTLVPEIADGEAGILFYNPSTALNRTVCIDGMCEKNPSEVVPYTRFASASAPIPPLCRPMNARNHAPEVSAYLNHFVFNRCQILTDRTIRGGVKKDASVPVGASQLKCASEKSGIYKHRTFAHVAVMLRQPRYIFVERDADGGQLFGCNGEKYDWNNIRIGPTIEGAYGIYRVIAMYYARDDDAKFDEVRSERVYPPSDDASAPKYGFTTQTTVCDLDIDRDISTVHNALVRPIEPEPKGTCERPYKELDAEPRVTGILLERLA